MASKIIGLIPSIKALWRNLFILLFGVLFPLLGRAQIPVLPANRPLRERIEFNNNWKFFKYPADTQADDLCYAIRPPIHELQDARPADAKPTMPPEIKDLPAGLKPWVLPTGNELIKDPAKRYSRPTGDPGREFPFVQKDYDDSRWELVTLPHDWAIKGPFYQGDPAEVGGGMGRLPSPGVAWYRKKLFIPAADRGKSIFLNIDGAMAYAIVWINGHLAGGWPSGYTSLRLDLTPYILPGDTNQLAIRLDNPNHAMRWYPGGGIYRSVWLIKTHPIHIAHYGTFITTEDVSSAAVTLKIEVSIENTTSQDSRVKVITQIFNIDAAGHQTGSAVATFEPIEVRVPAEGTQSVKSSIRLPNPRLWGPPPSQKPNRYLAITTLFRGDQPIDQTETRFGIRTLRFAPDSGIYINGEHLKIQGVNLHHDLGAVGTAFNQRAAERQLEILQEMGCNAIRTAHNPPAPELLELTDRLGFLVMDEAFDMWLIGKNPHDAHLIFADWYEQDLRAMVRRDRNCPSVIIWSIGNEVGEQYTGAEGAELARRLYTIVKEEDPTRPVTCAMNWAKPDMPLPAVLDIISLNYQGEGIRQDQEFEGTERIRTAPQYAAFHQQFPDKVILSSETASTLSSRGVYLFPVTGKLSDIVRDGRGGDSRLCQVTAYELHAADFGSSPDKVFGMLDRHPFVAGEFVWCGFDYLGEPTPYYTARSSYAGILDLAGFKKDRFYLYQSRWRPEWPMVHILPHWNWPERVGLITPVHVFTSGDAVELFLNGKSLGRKAKGACEYRLRWDEVRYEPGELRAVAYKNGTKWAEEIVKTTGAPVGIEMVADREVIAADGRDLVFVMVRVIDQEERTVPTASNLIKFTLDGCGEIVATDNGDPTDFTPFPSPERKAFGGLALVILRAIPDKPGAILLTATSTGLSPARLTIRSQ